MSKVIKVDVPRVDMSKDEDPKKMMETAKFLQSTMQKSWWEFAKILEKIKTTEAYAKLGYDSFGDYCEHEHPSIDRATLIKYTLVVEHWHDAIETRIAKDDEFKIPAYSTCYLLTTKSTESLPKEDISKLKKSVLDGKLSYHFLSEKLKTIIASYKKKVEDKSKEDMEKLDSEVMSEISKIDEDDADTDEGVEIYTEETEDEDEDVEDSFDVDEEPMPKAPSKGVINLIASVKHLSDNLPILTKSIQKKKKVSDGEIELAIALTGDDDDSKEIKAIVDNYLTAVEENQE